MNDKLLSYPKDKIKIVLLEKIHPAAQETFQAAGYTAIEVPKALPEAELTAIIQEAHILGLRSRTQLRHEHITMAKKLLAVGCFSIGTDQVDLTSARIQGIPVFNAPYSSTRSVAELTIANVLSLARRLGEQNLFMHQGQWQKTADNAFEIRGKTLGIIGYGHIGQQVGLLAEALGMNVYYHDIVKKLPLGRATPIHSLSALLEMSQFVTLHVPSTPQTHHLINQSELATMPKGSYLINLSRGHVVNLAALEEALSSKHLQGAALDVFPDEPEKNIDIFTSNLIQHTNVILTPHIGGSTVEAQQNIAREVATSLIGCIDEGSTLGAVNFPEGRLPPLPGSHRILYIHRNLPGALAEVNHIISELGANIDAQYLCTSQEVGYLLMDINQAVSEEVHTRIRKLDMAIKTRILY